MYNTIYTFWAYLNQKVIFWFIILLLVLLVHGTTGKCGFETHFLHLVFIEIYLIIFNSYDIVMTGYMHTMLTLCVLNDYVSIYNVIFIIHLPLKVSIRTVIPNLRPRECEWM